MRHRFSARRPRWAALAVAALSITLSLSTIDVAGACGAHSDCRVGARTYRIHLPAGHNGTTPIGAIIFMHGYRGTAAGIMRNKSLVRAVSSLGLALIAPKSAGQDWDIPNAPSPGKREELSFFDALVADVTGRFSIDPQRLMASGFSAGGMMVWNLACHRSDLFAGFAPIAGTFWAPVPDQCRGSVPNIIHTHGTTDKVVPLTGRAIASTRQGNVYRAIEMMASHGGFTEESEAQAGGLTCQRKSNAARKILELCLHAGGHSIRSAWVVRAWREFVKMGAISS